MTSISNNRPRIAQVSTPATAKATSSTSSAATAQSTGSSTASSFQAATGGPKTFKGAVNAGLEALKDVDGGSKLSAFLSKYPTKSGLKQAEKDLESLKGSMSEEQYSAVHDALQAQSTKLGTQMLMNSIAEAVREALKKSGGG